MPVAPVPRRIAAPTTNSTGATVNLLNTSTIQHDLDALSSTVPLHVPAPLWKALVETHNPSQIEAIRDVCVGSPAMKQDNILTLLQGPPVSDLN